MKVIKISEAEENLSELIEKAQKGEEIIIGQVNKPMVKLVPIELDTLNTQPRDMTQRIWENDIWIADDAGIIPNKNR